MLIIYGMLLLLIYCVIALDSKKSLHMLQQNLYNENNRYLKWIVKNKDLFFNIQIGSIIITIIGSFVVAGMENILDGLVIILVALYAYEVYRLSKLKEEDSKKEKKPLVITKRVKRLILTTTVLYLIPTVILCVNYKNVSMIWIMLLIISIITFLNRFVVLLSNIINYPYERGVYNYYKIKAKNKLKNMPNLKIVGITGSYGKTSSKNILADILNVKYNALPTPRNLNTYNGLIMTVNNHMDKFTDVFIAEMGAYVKGEIKGLCDLVHPKYGILTRIGTAHLESFGSEENIQKGKFELIESLPSDGIGVLNRDDPNKFYFVF